MDFRRMTTSSNERRSAASMASVDKNDSFVCNHYRRAASLGKLTRIQILLPGPPVPTTPQILPPDPPVPTTPQILLPDPPAPTTPQILLPDPPKQTTPQILLPDPPVVKTLEPTFTDDYSMDQILSSVFGDYLRQGIPLTHTQEPQVLDTVPSLFDESNDLISFLDNFEAGLALEQQETPMDLTMPRMKHYWIQSD
ncbi:hypothetical protein TNCV_2208651 [Trichonephila clavipes]|nr:hypothetical protein TNCV_2208651 [Trichonephila clavipes]